MSPYRYAAGGGGGAWATTATLVPNSNSSGYSGYTLRVVIPAAALAVGSKIRLTLQARPANAMTIGAAYVQTAAASGDSYDFSGTPVQILFSGSGTVTVAANTSVVTDAALITIGAGQNVVFTLYFTSASSIVTTTGATGWGSFYNNGNSAATVNVSATSLSTNTAAVASKVEVWS